LCEHRSTGGETVNIRRTCFTAIDAEIHQRGVVDQHDYNIWLLRRLGLHSSDPEAGEKGEYSEAKQHVESV